MNFLIQRTLIRAVSFRNMPFWCYMVPTIPVAWDISPDFPSSAGQCSFGGIYHKLYSLQSAM